MAGGGEGGGGEGVTVFLEIFKEKALELSLRGRGECWVFSSSTITYV